MSKIGLTVEQINAMEPTAIVRNDNVRDKFIQIYEAMWRPSTGTSGEAAYERTAHNFNTGKPLVIPAHTSVKLRASKELIKAINEGKEATL